MPGGIVTLELTIIERQGCSAVTSLSLHNDAASAEGLLRPVNLRTDLAPLADLIELVFADSMDNSGRAAVREMRYLSRMGAGLAMVPGLSDLAQGISLGYVWIADDRLVGNVSIYPVDWPSEMGKIWVIANVAVHPDYQGRGIATRLMRASMEAVRRRGGGVAMLQVDLDNPTARHLYRRLGFVEERAWTLWRRSGYLRPPPPFDQNVFIAHRRPHEWRAEYALAQRLRPAQMGGMGWQRPLHISLFRRPLLSLLGDWLSLRHIERLVIRYPADESLLASMWIEAGGMSSSVQLTLLVDPAYCGLYDEALISNAVRRFGDSRAALLIEHPADERVTAELLRRYAFRPMREVMHMRWDTR